MKHREKMVLKTMCFFDIDFFAFFFLHIFTFLGFSSFYSSFRLDLFFPNTFFWKYGNVIISKTHPFIQQGSQTWSLAKQGNKIE